MITATKTKTATLRLVGLEREHLEFLRGLRNDPQMTDQLLSPALPLSSEQQKQWFERQISDRQNLLLIAEADKPVGYGQLQRIDYTHRSCELGCHIATPFQGRGYGKALVRALLQTAFITLGLHRVYLHVLERNERAIAVYKACGFRQEGVQRDGAYKLGRFVNVTVMSILAPEYDGKPATDTACSR